jgi:heptosyltransferase-3
MIRRYEGEDLGPRPRIAVVGSDQLPDFVVTTPLLRGLKERFPEATVDFYGGPVNREFEEACPWIDWRTDVYPEDPRRLMAAVRGVVDRTSGHGYDLAINCDGFNPYTRELATRLAPRFVAGQALTEDLGGPLPLGGHPNHRLLADPDWSSPRLLERYAGHLTSNYLGELLARIAFIETDYFAISLESAPPPFEVPEVLVHANANRIAKLWPAGSWLSVLDWCASRDLTVGLVGVLPGDGQERTQGFPVETELAEHSVVTDLRGRTSPLELAGAFEAARACVSVDSGAMHVAAAVGCPTVAIFGNDEEGTGASPVQLWLPRVDNVTRTVSTHRCSLCEQNRFTNDACLKTVHACMEGVTPAAVVALLHEELRGTDPEV